MAGSNGATTPSAKGLPIVQRRECERERDRECELDFLRDLLPLVSPALERCLFTMRAATSFARPL
ncbi:MAG TPA: hypothetical protein VFB72_01620 [Verrucomicrobiae bacterium]|nr:hypothetical protein [Verrucomicrobiae bacterium]